MTKTKLMRIPYELDEAIEKYRQYDKEPKWSILVRILKVKGLYNG